MRIKKTINSQNISISEVGWIDDIFSLSISRPVQFKLLGEHSSAKSFSAFYS